MEIKKLMVIGAGQMGSGIAQVAAEAGYQVILNDIKPEFVEKGTAGIAKNLDRKVTKGNMTEEAKAEVLSRIKGSTSLQDAAEADLVVEAAIENLDLKGKIFTDLDSICPAHTILATNTSSLPITQIATYTKRPDKVIGMHFFNPVPVMKLVEIIRGIATSDETYDAVQKMALDLKKTPVQVNDFPGFVVNRLLIPLINEAFYAVFEGVATPEAVDEGMKLGANHPMGPLALADLIGLDTCLAIMEVLYAGFGDSKYRPCPLLRKYVKAGWLGRKSGKGVFTY